MIGGNIVVTVIFNKNQDNELSYTFDTYSETYTREEGFNLRFGAFEERLLLINGNLADYLSDLLTTPNYVINTIDVYNSKQQLIDSFDDYHIIAECITFYEPTIQAQRSELRLIRD